MVALILLAIVLLTLGLIFGILIALHLSTIDSDTDEGDGLH